MSGIEITNLVKRWPTVTAVDDISFTVAPGTLTVLLGPSGCGKSTTLRLIAGLDTVTSGQIRISGHDVTNAPPARRGLSMVFQSYALFPHLTVRENIIFGLRVRQISGGERERRLAKAAGLLGLDNLLDRRPSQLSGGQQQRVALGRAIVAEAPVCLMDEPLSNLDAQLRHEMRKEIRSIQQTLGMTMIYVTHDQIEAMSLADQVVLMRGGHIEQKAVPSELYQWPATTFAARFIGTPAMNVITLADGPVGATIEGSDGAPLFEGSGRGLMLGLRPEHIHLAAEGPFLAEIRSVDYHGADSILECAIGSQILFVRAEGISDLAAGQRVRLAWETRAMHLFDAESGRRLDRNPLSGHSPDRLLRAVP